MITTKTKFSLTKSNYAPFKYPETGKTKLMTKQSDSYAMPFERFGDFPLQRQIFLQERSQSRMLPKRK